MTIVNNAGNLIEGGIKEGEKEHCFVATKEEIKKNPKDRFEFGRILVHY